jgi:hypothetical protein
MIVAMPHDGAIIFSDLIGKLDVLRVACEKCERDGCYGLSRLIDKRRRDAKVIDWLDELTADCPKRVTVNWNDRCRGCAARICRGCAEMPKRIWGSNGEASWWRLRLLAA